MKPKALILTGYGINCDYETAAAFQLPAVGGEAERVHLNDLITRPVLLHRYQILVLPGGFSFGDDIASGKVLANRLRYRLSEALTTFLEAGKLILGICNGFQVLIKMGLLPEPTFVQQATITFNDSGRFEDRWVYLKVHPNPSPFLRGIEHLYLPVRHGEGKFIPRDATVCTRLWQQQQVCLQYVDPEGKVAGYPWNPNGSVDNIAGICDPSGRIFGLMPHPEAYLVPTNHPRWTREKIPAEGMGVQIFRNAVNYVRENL
ncbi:MAG: phosphoribosylformylglycinamidine synthase I [Nitrospinota bacterium]|nr:MAG: phosphoribosylformylglycinamidine synthase I [Nitrospinota bacterium]